MLEHNSRVFCLILLCAMSFFIGLLIGEYETKEPIIIRQEKEVVYLELPTIVQLEEDVEVVPTIAEVEARALDNYMNTRTNQNAEEWWNGYNLLVSSFEEPPVSITDIYSAEELSYLYRTVETETHGADFLSKSHVARVVLNRVEDQGRFSGKSTIKAVVTSPSQFVYGNTNITESTKAACAYAFVMEDETQGALFFHSGEKTDTFNRANYVLTDSCGHHFYK